MPNMKTPNSETKVGGIRLSHEDWKKLRAIMAARKGRAWLESFIRREYKRIPTTSVDTQS